MGYHTAEEIPNYWDYAKTYTLHDRMFAPTDSWTLPAHLFLVSGWSATCPDLDDPMSCYSDQKFPGGMWAHTGKQWIPVGRRTPPVHLGGHHVDALHEHGISWSYYVGDGTCVAPPCEKLEGIETAPVQNPLPGFQSVQATGQLSEIRPNTEFFRGADRAPAVRLVGHAGDRIAPSTRPTTSRTGMSWVTKIVNSVMQGPAVGTVRDLPDVGRLGRLLRSRRAARRRRERVGTARPEHGDQPVGEAGVHRPSDAVVRRVPQVDRGPVPGRRAARPGDRWLAGLAPHGPGGRGVAGRPARTTSTSARIRSRR